MSTEVASARDRVRSCRWHRFRCTLVLLLLGAALGCGGDDTPTMPTGIAMSDASAQQVADAAPAATGAKFSEIYPLIFPALTNPRCDSCHAMPASDRSNGKLHMGMDRDAAYSALVSKTSTSKACMGRPLVVPGQPEMSLLWQKLSPTPPCGDRMPIGGAPLTEETMHMLHSWIEAGAQNN